MSKGNKDSEIIIEEVWPSVDGGVIPARGSVNFTQEIGAKIYAHGNTIIRARIRYIEPDGKKWKTAEMQMKDNDVYQGFIELQNTGIYRFLIEAWFDDASTWLENYIKWEKSGEDISQDLKTGLNFLFNAVKKAGPRDKKKINSAINVAKEDNSEFINLFRNNINTLERYTEKRKLIKSEIFRINSYRRNMFFGAWYEMFPRSQSPIQGKHGTFKDCINRLEDISDMGFNVIYLPPIHPIGKTNRRGKNGIIPISQGEPGSPWAIGNSDGGHKAINPDLGSLSDFKEFISIAGKYNIDIAIDLAFQCSPDHPYVIEHPEWFYHRPDGTIRYAENPPKKYFDIYPLNFDCDDKDSLWKELKGVVNYWISVGIRIFRVDNPHTKPFTFWKWLLSEILSEHPEVSFLSEAFTKSSVMYKLSKIGFQQSYTYFTWKNYDWEIREYFTELNSPSISAFFRPMLFVNTPDILPFILQTGGKPAFALRALLGATLSPLWGIYSGFELCENEGIPNREEYMDSEKFQIKQRDWNARGNIKPLISRLNSIRNEFRQFQIHGNAQFMKSDNPNILAYYRSYNGLPSIMIIVNINPFEINAGSMNAPPDWINDEISTPFLVKDLLTDEEITWNMENNTVKLVPEYRFALILMKVVK
ncbi:MAG: alpha-1,4-glucan--maltose-1-phosphate maltosyltransferase [Thermoplasmataceae archaeon]